MGTSQGKRNPLAPTHVSQVKEGIREFVVEFQKGWGPRASLYLDQEKPFKITYCEIQKQLGPKKASLNWDHTKSNRRH